MRPAHSHIWTHQIEPCRVNTGLVRSSNRDGRNGFFEFPGGLRVLCSDGLGWEHVSVSYSHRCPTWEEMCQIKDLFWDDEEVVVQYHPKKSEYVNCFPWCLHLWKPTEAILPVPASILVGPLK